MSARRALPLIDDESWCPACRRGDHYCVTCDSPIEHDPDIADIQCDVCIAAELPIPIWAIDGSK